MSEPIASTYVEIRPQVAPNFQQDLKRQVQADVDSATASLKMKLGADRFSRLEKTGTVAAFQRNAALQAETQYLRSFEQAQIATAASTGRVSSALSMGVSRLGLYGLAIGSVYQGARKLAEVLEVTDEKANTLSGSLRNAGASALRGDIAGFASQAGQSAALAFAPGAEQAAEAANAAKARETELQKAIELAAQFVKIRQQAAAASGQVGTEEGVVKFQLEQQLRILKAQVKALPKDANRVAFAQLGLGPNGTQNAKLFERTKTGRPSDLDFELQAARASATKVASDDLELYRGRKQFLTGLIGRAEAAGAETDAAKNNLKRLYGMLDSADDQINALQKQSQADRQAALMERISLQQIDLQIQQANARNDSQEIAAIRAQAAAATKLSGDKRLDAQQRAQFELQAAQAERQVFEIQKSNAAQAAANAKAAAALREQERKAALEKLKAQREEAVQLRELRLENAISAAGLTKRTSDDKKAIKAQIRYYRDLVKSTTGLEREQARSRLISARSSLQGIQQQKAQERGASAAEFFAMAAQQFGQFGSNIAQRGGTLSGQDARARFAATALAGKDGQSIAMAIDGLGKIARPQLTEAQKQTALLARIARGVARFGTPDSIDDRKSINNARAKAFHLGGV